MAIEKSNVVILSELTNNAKNGQIDVDAVRHSAVVNIHELKIKYGLNKYGVELAVDKLAKYLPEDWYDKWKNDSDPEMWNKAVKGFCDDKSVFSNMDYQNKWEIGDTTSRIMTAGGVLAENRHKILNESISELDRLNNEKPLKISNLSVDGPHAVMAETQPTVMKPTAENPHGLTRAGQALLDALSREKNEEVDLGDLVSKSDFFNDVSNEEKSKVDKIVSGEKDEEASEQDDALSWLESLAEPSAKKAEDLTLAGEPDKSLDSDRDWWNSFLENPDYKVNTRNPDTATDTSDNTTQNDQGVGKASQEEIDDALSWLESLASVDNSKKGGSGTGEGHLDVPDFLLSDEEREANQNKNNLETPPALDVPEFLNVKTLEKAEVPIKQTDDSKLDEEIDDALSWLESLGKKPVTETKKDTRDSFWDEK